MSKEEKINCQDLLTLLEEAKDKVKEAGLRCDTIHMNPKIYTLILAGLQDLSDLKKLPFSNVMLLGLKLVKHKIMPENVVIFSYQGKVRRIEDWSLEGVKNNGTQKNKEKESTNKCSVQSRETMDSK